jgi:tRNA pseudouridine65 synthase
VNSPLKILFRDEQFIAVDKPVGMLVHRGGEADPDQPALLQTLRDQIGQRVFPAHRLDQPTSGVVLFGLNAAAAATLVDLFTNHQMHKYYQAIVRGWLHPEGCLRNPLLPLHSNIDSENSLDKQDYQAAITQFSTIRWYEGPWKIGDLPTTRFTWLEASPRTGRWHQIRRHLKHIAHPILGDYRHGDPRCNAWLESECQTNTMMLSAVYLQFKHPFTRQEVAIRGQRHQAFDSVLKYLSPFSISIDPSKLSPQPIGQRVDSSA